MKKKQKSSKELFLELFERKCNLVYKMINDWVPPEYGGDIDIRNELIEEINQDVWLTLTKHREKLIVMEDKAIDSYIRSTVRSVYLGEMRNRENNLKLMKELQVLQTIQNDSFNGNSYNIYDDDEKLYKIVADIVSSLPEHEQEYIYFCHVKRLKSEDVAKLFDTTANAVRKRLQRIVIKMRRQAIMLINEDDINE